jgi:hypothetical protein
MRPDPHGAAALEAGALYVPPNKRDFAMRKSRPFTTADADRLLGLADQFLEDWGESARRHGECAHDCEERAAEWEAIRPLLASAPNLLAVLDEAEICGGDEFASDNPINGGDLVAWFAAWLPKARAAIAVAQGQETETAG